MDQVNVATRACRLSQPYVAWLAAIAALLLNHCSSSTLQSSSSNATNLISLVGNVCTRMPISSLSNIKILYLLDASDGMAFVDPSDLYVGGLADVANQFINRNNVSFGFVQYGQTARLTYQETSSPNTLFSNDPMLLGQVFAYLRKTVAQNPQKYLGSTDFTVAMTAAQQYIAADVAASVTTSDRTIGTTYLVEMVAGSQPQAGTANANVTVTAILNDENAMLAAAANVSLDMYTLFQTNVVPAVFQNLFSTMANLGKGGLVMVQTPNDLSNSLIATLDGRLIYNLLDLAPLAVGNQDIKSNLIYNRNQVVSIANDIVTSYVDSDTDGLSDVYEIAQGYDPTRADTDGDGLDDFFEDRYSDIFSVVIPIDPPLGQAQLTDSDSDGLNDFEENQIGTLPSQADSDIDGISDFIEFRNSTNPLVSDMSADLDNDGRLNYTEILQHTNPNLAEPNDVVTQFAYQITQLGSPTQTADGRYCYSVHVSNVAINETLSSLYLDNYQYPGGNNSFEILNLERPLPMSLNPIVVGYPNRIHRGGVDMIVRPSSGFRDMPAYTITVRPAEF